MNRVPAKLAVLLLHQEADASGDERLRIRPATLRKWVERGHITRGDGGYDLAEILGYLEQRERSTSVDDLITWLRAQTDDDERVLTGASDERMARMAQFGRTIVADAGFLETFTRDRLLREVEAKRRIIASELSPYPEAAHADVATVTLRLLALPYADRPGYREEWRPL